MIEKFDGIPLYILIALNIMVFVDMFIDMRPMAMVGFALSLACFFLIRLKRFFVLSLPFIIFGTLIFDDFCWFFLPMILVYCFSDIPETGKRIYRVLISLIWIAAFVFTKYMGHYDFLGEGLDFGINRITPGKETIFAAVIIYSGFVYYSKWKEKKDDRIFIRGSSAMILLIILSVLKSMYISAFLLWFCIFFLLENIDVKDDLKKITDHYYTKIIFCFCLVLVILRSGDFGYIVHKYSIAPYYLNYEQFGPVKRALIGDIFYHLFGYYISYGTMVRYAMIFYACAGVAVAVLALILWKKITVKDPISISLAGLFFVSPFLSYFIELKARFDLYLFLLALISIYLIIKNTNAMWLVPVFSVVSVLIHTVYIFCFFPLILMTMIYRVRIMNGENKRRNMVIVKVFIFLTMAVLVYLSCFSYKNSKVDIKKGISIYEERSGDSITESFEETLEAVVLSSPRGHIGNRYAKDLGPGDVIVNIERMLGFLPLTLLYFYIFLDCSGKYGGIRKILCRCIPFGVMGIFPLYLFAIDYGRWNLHYVLYMIVSILYLQLVEGVNIIPEKIQKYSKETGLLILLAGSSGGIFGIFS